SIFESTRPLSPADLEPVAVPEKFSWLAFLLPPVFALLHGLTLFTLLWIAGVVVTIGLAVWAGGGAAFWVYVVFALFLGFEASSFRRGRLERAGRVYRADIVA